MRLFASNKDRAEIDEDMAGLVRARVEIKRLDRNTRHVKVVIVDCQSGKTVYKSDYQTKATTDYFAYNHAVDELKQVIKREDYILFDAVSTNIELPSIVTSSKRMR